MELALNLGWLALTALLCGGCVRAHRRGTLRLPLLAAVGCSLLLAMLLFPAISMTDDLQRSDLELEGRVRAVAQLAAATLPSLSEVFLVLLLALLFAGALAQTRLRWLSEPRECRTRFLAFRVAALAVRPPTFSPAFA